MADVWNGRRPLGRPPAHVTTAAHHRHTAAHHNGPQRRVGGACRKIPRALHTTEPPHDGALAERHGRSPDRGRSPRPTGRRTPSGAPPPPTGGGRRDSTRCTAQGPAEAVLGGDWESSSPFPPVPPPPEGLPPVARGGGGPGGTLAHWDPRDQSRPQKSGRRALLRSCSAALGRHAGPHTRASKGSPRRRRRGGGSPRRLRPHRRGSQDRRERGACPARARNAVTRRRWCPGGPRRRGSPFRCGWRGRAGGSGLHAEEGDRLALPLPQLRQHLLGLLRELLLVLRVVNTEGRGEGEGEGARRVLAGAPLKGGWVGGGVQPPPPPPTRRRWC